MLKSSIFLVFVLTNLLYSLNLELVKIIPAGGAPKSIRITPDKKYAFVQNLEGCSISIIDTEKLEIVKKISFHKTKGRGYNYKLKKFFSSIQEKPVEIDFSPDSRFAFISLHNSGSIVVYDLTEEFEPLVDFKKAKVVSEKAKKEIKLLNIKTGTTPKVVKVSPDGNYVYVANWHSHTVSVIDARNLTKIKNIQVGLVPRGIIFTPDSKYAYVANMGGNTLTLIDVQNNHTKLKEIFVGSNPRHIVIDNNGEYLYISHNREGKVRKFDIKQEKVIGVCNVGKNPRTIVLSPDGRYLFVVNYKSNNLSVVETATMRVILTKKTGIHPVGIDILDKEQDLVFVSNYSSNNIYVYRIEND